MIFHFSNRHFREVAIYFPVLTLNECVDLRGLAVMVLFYTLNYFLYKIKIINSWNDCWKTERFYHYPNDWNNTYVLTKSTYISSPSFYLPLWFDFNTNHRRSLLFLSFILKIHSLSYFFQNTGNTETVIAKKRYKSSIGYLMQDRTQNNINISVRKKHFQNAYSCC